MTRLAMGWVFQNPDVSTVLAGVRTKAHLDNALAAESMDFPQRMARGDEHLGLIQLG